MILKTPESTDLPIIFDNTVLSNFALVEVFEILRELYADRAFVSQAVLQEVQAGRQTGWQYPWLSSRRRLEAIVLALSQGWFQLPPPLSDVNRKQQEAQLAQEYGERFGKGEAESMAIALCRGWVFASDDGAARRFAQAQPIKLTGTLGILIKATQSGILTQADADGIHGLMIDEGYRSPFPYENGISSFLNR